MNLHKFIIIISYCLLLESCDKFAAGSYPYVECYELNIRESIVIKAIQRVKQKHPIYVPPSKAYTPDGRDNPDTYWYSVYFYYPEENQIVYTWTRPKKETDLDDIYYTKTTIGLIGISDVAVKDNFLLINKDFSNDENEIQKRKFETLILNKIKSELLLMKAEGVY
jgi:hypothetical protein